MVLFGKQVAHVYVIEFQKRGLPHAHILLVLAEQDKAITIDQINSLVSAEIPNRETHPLAYETVSKCLMHGPCGPSFPNAPCMKDGYCSKGYPKAFTEVTHLANDR